MYCTNVYNFQSGKQYWLQCPSHNIIVLRYYFLFSYFCNAHIVSSPWGPQVPNNTSTLFVETSDSYSSHKETSLDNTNDGKEALFGDLSYMSANKEGWCNHIQEYCCLLCAFGWTEQIYPCIFTMASKYILVHKWKISG